MDELNTIRLAEKALAQDEHLSNVLRMRKLGKIALFAWPLFALVDWYVVTFVHPGRLWFYLSLRAIGMVLLLLAAIKIFSRKIPTPNTLRFIDVSMFTIITVFISIQCLEFNGIVSPFTLGIITVLICRSAIMADHWKIALLPVGLMTMAHPLTLIVMGLIYPSISEQFADTRLISGFLLNQLFLFAAATITLVGGQATWELRRQVFKARSLGRYRLKKRIGAGGMGEVWTAHHATLKREVAVKILRPDKQLEKYAAARFEREVQATASLSHPNTVRVFDYGITEDGICYYAMELLNGRDIGQIIAEEGPLPAERAANLIQQAALALAEAHARGIVHRDIKPANLFVTSVAGQNELVKVLDFGLAKFWENPGDPVLTQEGWAVGTPTYLPPEVLRGKVADARSDIYALGGVLYHLLCKEPPFPGTDTREILTAHLKQKPVPLAQRTTNIVPQALEKIVLRCLEKKPEMRYQTATELAQALEMCI